MRNLGIVNRLIIKPTYEVLKDDFENIFNNSLYLFKSIYILILSIFLSLFFVCYLFVWKPFEQNLSDNIYKTKNILSIIPKEILAGLNNIHKILGIEPNSLKKEKVNNTVISNM